MDRAEFLSKTDIYTGDYNGILRGPDNEFCHGFHYHDFYELVLYLGDAGIFCTENEEYTLHRADLVLISMFRPHFLLRNTDSDYQRFSIDIDLGLLISYSTPASNLLDIFYNDTPVYHLTEEQFQKYLLLIDEYRRLTPARGHDILEKALIHRLLAYAYNDCVSDEHMDETAIRHMQVIRRLLHYIDGHLSETITVRELAEEVHYSEYYLSRLFKKITGKTLTGYILEKKIETAAFLLRSGNRSSQAAEQAGFRNYSYFYKSFKKYMHMSPAEYRDLYDRKQNILFEV
ncbi:MAG: AraC family transcriptional regulator [Lachnospiraceae bacterium]|nr:AraC family transcriptional regulator [Lachnospiraceae bacterium]